MPDLVLCLHAFASNGRQFHGLAKRLQPRFRVAAPDLGSPSWREQLRRSPLYLVGHSYGGSLALRRAAAHPVRALALYEPTLWGTLSYLFPQDPATLEIEALRDDTARLVRAGRLEDAAERFIDYWTGAGSWAATPAERRPKVLQAMRELPAAWGETFAERWNAQALRFLDVPCLLLTGSRTTNAARRAVRFLAESLPNSTLVEIEGAGHMGPLTHASQVDAAIETFLLTERSLQ